jgi:hypothetical protein
MLGLLDHHGVSRAEAYRSMTEGAVAALIDRINDDVNVLPTNKLLEVGAHAPAQVETGERRDLSWLEAAWLKVSGCVAACR